MSVIGWIVLGLIAGFIASKAVSGRGAGCLPDIALGLVGALVGGYLFSALAHHDFMMRFDLASMLIAILGAVVVLVIWHAIFGRGLR
ncbi:MAG TPA: GlsB/YeaQ/YmgE family stress response membrane protein [Rhizomicrobium sp.]|jgi:uncharacterized membrane protein YeaQ/YmgE (transglycosylase-associated protein family)